MNFENYFAISIDPYYYAVLLVDFVLLFAMLVLVRQIFGRSAGGIDTSVELGEKDNHAFGISLAGATIGLAVVFAGVASGDVASSLIIEGLYVLGYGILGIVMLMCTRFIFDKITFPKIDFKEMISEKNNAAGILDAGNMIATSAIIFGVFSWLSGDWLTSLILIVGMFIITQLLLVVVSRYRVQLFSKRNEGRAFRDAINEGNSALAIRFAGFQIGAALAMSTAGKLVVFQDDLNVFISVAAWTFVAIVLLVAVILLTMLIEKVILYGVPVDREVDREANYGVATIEAGSYIGLGFLIVSLLG